MGTRTITMSHEELDRFGVITRVQRTAADAGRGCADAGTRRCARCNGCARPCVTTVPTGSCCRANAAVPVQPSVPGAADADDRHADHRALRGLWSHACQREAGPNATGSASRTETVRKLDDPGFGLWKTRAQRKPKIQQPRPRRPCFGELIQIDGSDHRWFEDRASMCVLLVFVDDATGQLVGMRFCESESTFEYMEVTKRYLLEYGKPVALYSDKHSVFRVNKVGATHGEGMRRSLAGLYTTSTSRAFAPTRRPPRVASSVPTRRSRTVWSRSCAWRVSPRSTAATRSWNRSDRTLTRGSGKLPASDHNAHRKAAFKAERVRSSTTCSAGKSRAPCRPRSRLQYDKLRDLPGSRRAPIRTWWPANTSPCATTRTVGSKSGSRDANFPTRSSIASARSTRATSSATNGSAPCSRSPATRSSRIPSAAAPAVRHVVTQPQKPTAEARTSAACGGRPRPSTS